ncbi:MAG: dUTP diphosphatase [Candidatus Buchananbacteria bacterium]|nr:dUTP diphosphatase [Candidatus Buchananbacteria bacterium]
MKVKITRIDKSLPLPEYQTKGSVAFDLYSRINLEIKPQEIALIPTNLIIQTPRNYMLLIASRSSNPQKLGLLKPHGIGIIDQDYCGSEDEIKVQVMNFIDKSVNIKKGQRIGQATFVKINKANWQEIDKINKKSRGGFGSTG